MPNTGPNDAPDERTINQLPISAADVDPGGYTEVEFDSKQCYTHRKLAEKWAPKPKLSYRHHIDIAGKHAVSVRWGIPFDTRIMDDYEGDNGYILEYPQQGDRSFRVEVETTLKQEPAATIKEDQVDKADLFVLCRTNSGIDRVEIIGYTWPPLEKEFGNYHGRTGYQLVPEYLHPTTGKYITPEEVRNITNRL